MCRSTTACQASAIDIDALALDAPDIDNDLESYQVDKWHGYQLFERSQVQTLPYHCTPVQGQMGAEFDVSCYWSMFHRKTATN